MSHRGHPCSVAHWWHMQPVPLMPWCLDSIFVLSRGNIVTVASCIRPPSLQLHVMGENFLQVHFWALFGLFFSLQYSGGTVYCYSLARWKITIQSLKQCSVPMVWSCFNIDMYIQIYIYIFFFFCNCIDAMVSNSILWQHMLYQWLCRTWLSNACSK